MSGGHVKNRMTAKAARGEDKRKHVARLKGQLRLRGLPEPEEEVRFHEWRRWRFDLAWPSLKVAVEYEGGTWSSKPSRHTGSVGYRNDCTKYSEAAIAGWAVVRITADMLKDGTGADLAQRAYRARAAEVSGRAHA